MLYNESDETNIATFTKEGASRKYYTLFIGKEELRTITMNLYVFRSSTNTEWDLFIAGLTVSLIPIVIIYILAQKHITSGLTAGAIK